VILTQSMGSSPHDGIFESTMVIWAVYAGASIGLWSKSWGEPVDNITHKGLRSKDSTQSSRITEGLSSRSAKPSLAEFLKHPR
jgi:hypothetical protein